MPSASVPGARLRERPAAASLTPLLIFLRNRWALPRVASAGPSDSAWCTQPDGGCRLCGLSATAPKPPQLSLALTRQAHGRTRCCAPLSNAGLKAGASWASHPASPVPQVHTRMLKGLLSLGLAGRRSDGSGGAAPGVGSSHKSPSALPAQVRGGSAPTRVVPGGSTAHLRLLSNYSCHAPPHSVPLPAGRCGLREPGPAQRPAPPAPAQCAGVGGGTHERSSQQGSDAAASRQVCAAC